MKVRATQSGSEKRPLALPKNLPGFSGKNTMSSPSLESPGRFQETPSLRSLVPVRGERGPLFRSFQKLIGRNGSDLIPSLKARRPRDRTLHSVLLTGNSLTRPHMAHIAHTRTPLSSPSLDKCTRTSTVSFCNKTQDSGTVPWPNTPFCVPVVYTSRDLTWLTWQRKCQNRVSLSRIANLLLTPLTPFVSRAQFRPGSNLFADPHSAPSD